MGLFRRGKATAAASKTRDSARDAGGDTPATGPSPNPMTNLLLADIALRAGGALLKRGVETGILGQAVGAKKAARAIKGGSMAQTLVRAALTRVATRSVPGAIVVGGGLLAKTLYERRRKRKAKAEGEADLERQAARGR